MARTKTPRPAPWVQALDFRRALRNCHLDFLGDWYRDPWGWCELDWAVTEALDEFVVPRVVGSGVRQAARLDVAKENFATRPAVVMDPLDRLCYQALVDALSERVIGDLRQWAYGWRLSPKSPVKGAWAGQSSEWKRYRSHLKRLAGVMHAALRTDIVSFFASVPIQRLSEDLLDRSGNALGERLVDMLAGFDAIHGRSGLPQRSAASAALAHFYLTPLDDVLAKYAPTRGLAAAMAPEGAVLRWMDDIWVFGGGAGNLRSAQVELQSAMRELGLYLNIAKTDVLEGDEVWNDANKIEHSAVDAGLSSRPSDTTQLTELVDSLLASPEHAERTSIKFATTRMRRYGDYERVGEFASSAPRMPHASDALARLFRDAEAWRDMQDWYVEYCTTSWACIDWSVAQFGTMFPSSELGSGIVAEFLTQHVGDHSLAVMALATQRLAAWTPDTLRQVIRETSKTADHPLLRRVLALGAVTAGEKRAFVRTLLREFEENAVTLRMLEETNFRVPKVKPDFEGG